MKKLEIKTSNKFLKDSEKMFKQGKDLEKMYAIVEKIANSEPLDRKYKDHALSGEYADCRECHIAPDWLLIYRIDEGNLILILTRTGSHSNLFG